jgi:hypothetical protein
MGINETGMHDCTMSCNFPVRLPRAGNISIRTDGGDYVAANGDRTVRVNGTIGVERQDAAIANDDVARVLS